MIKKQFFHLIGRQAVIMGMGADGVVKPCDIGNQALLQLLHGPEMSSVQFLLFEIFEKTLHHSIIIRMPFLGKGLDHVQGIQLFSKVRGGELRTPVRMEHNALRNTSAPDGIVERGNGKETVDSPTHPAGNDLSGIQIQDRADITEPTAHRDICKITNPDHIGRGLPKLLGQQIDAVSGILRGGL